MICKLYFIIEHQTNASISVLSLTGYYFVSLFLVETVSQHIVLIKIIGKLNLTLFVIRLSAPNFKYNDKTLAKIIDHDIHAFVVTSSAFDIVITHAVDDRADKEQETPFSLFLIKDFGFSFVNVVENCDLSQFMVGKPL